MAKPTAAGAAMMMIKRNSECMVTLPPGGRWARERPWGAALLRTRRSPVAAPVDHNRYDYAKDRHDEEDDAERPSGSHLGTREFHADSLPYFDDPIRRLRNVR
jgi:hypothetical protein